MENGRTKSGILSPDADSDRKSKKQTGNAATSSGDSGAAPAPVTPYGGAHTAPDDSVAPPGGAPQ
jgi:hypothetical protein